MGREIRMVPPNWDHPKEDYGDRLQPMYDQTFEVAAANWKKEFAEWESGVRPSYCDEKNSRLEFWEYHGDPPKRKYCRPYKDEDATWFQVWETVTEGTPVSPPFATKEEIANYLSEYGDFWDQKRGDGPWSKKAADAFVQAELTPSVIIVDGQMYTSKDAALADLEGK